MPEESSPGPGCAGGLRGHQRDLGSPLQEVQATMGRLVQAMVPYTRVNVLCHEG